MTVPMLRKCCALLICLCLLLPGTFTATAEPDTAESNDQELSPPISWTQLGLADQISIIGSNEPNDVAIRVPEGVSPALLIGQIGSVVNLAGGRVDVLDGTGLFLGSIPTPGGSASLPFSVNMSAANVRDGIVNLSLVLREDNVNLEGCVQPSRVTLTQLATQYAGASPNPQTVADFLPGYLSHITIRTGPDPSRDQQQAALSLVANLTHLYRPMPVRIDVDTSPSPPLAAAQAETTRVIEIRHGGQPALTVENPGIPGAVLAISGEGPALLRQVELFADRRASLAQTPSASVTSFKENKPVATTLLTFAQLGMTPSTSVLGTTTLFMGFDADAFGVGSIDNVKVHLIGHYTPIVAGEASVVLRSGSVVVASHVLDQSGTVELSGEIPAGPIGSNVGLALELRYIPRQDCSHYDRMAFSVDPESTITVSPGTNNRGGFPILPMAFIPDFDVAVDSGDQLGFAAQAINLMGQQATVALQPNVTTLDEAAQRRSGLLVVATGDELAKAGMHPPLLVDGSGAVEVDGNPVTGIDLHGPIGVVQAFAHNERVVLAIDASANGALVDRCLDYIRGLENRWASLSGDVVATGAAGTPVNLTVRAGGVAFQQVATEGWIWWIWISIAVGVAAILAAALTLIIRRRAKS